MDFRIALRTLCRYPAFTALAVVTLALGIASTTAIFSVVKAVLLTQLPYRDPDRVMALSQVGEWTAHELPTRTQSIESISLYGDTQRTLVDNGDPEVLRGLRVTHEFFETLGATMALGRTFTPAEDRWPRANVVILNHPLWVRRFASDPRIVGRVLQLTGEPYLVIGVLPPDFQPLRMSNPAEKPQIFMPAGYEPHRTALCRGCLDARAIARLRRGITLADARTDLNAAMREIVRQYPADFAPDISIRIAPLRDRMIAPILTPLYVLSAAVCALLLIACANLTSLLLARVTARSPELALRAALGAGRARIAAHLLTESLILSLAGGAAGALLAWPAIAILTSLAPRELPRLDEIHLDSSVLLFALGASLFAGLSVAIVPAWRAVRIDLNRELKRPARGGLRNLLVVAEIAMAFVLGVGAALLGKSLLRLTAVDSGFDPHHILTLTLSLSPNRYRTQDGARQYYRQVEQNLRAVPGVLDIGLVDNVPLSHTIPVKFRLSAGDTSASAADLFRASPGYFRVLKIPLRRGRLFTGQDGVTGPPTVIVSESFARSQFPGTDPIGQSIQLGPVNEHRPWLTIAGVVGDVRQEGLDRAPDQAIYIPQAADPLDYIRLLVRTTGDPLRSERGIRNAVRLADPDQPVFHVQPMDDYVASSLADRTFTLTLISLFGSIALLLAAIGIYGVISHTVGLRTRELGIRMALGAARSTVVRMILRDVLILLVSGLTAGVLAALALTRFLSHLLFEVRPTDITTAAGVALLLACVALLAASLPTLRAAAIDPNLALRSE
uniref:Permease n=1 Tax=Solibacter usitatus (strain Ellin6076) TaxID=234267 RepID=Q025C9_SOLUE